MTLAITFDTNVAIRIVNHILRRSLEEDRLFLELGRRITQRKLSPFVTEASLSFEVLPAEGRVLGVLSSFALLPEHRDLPRAEIDPAAAERIDRYVDVGFRVLHAPRIGLRTFMKIPALSWAPDERFNIDERMERYNTLVDRFAHMGPARLKELGAKSVRFHSLDTSLAQSLPGFPVPEQQMWADGLVAEVLKPTLFQSKREALGVIRKLFSDWFDLDSVASHYAYGLDFFCTEDKGRGKGKFEIFHLDNRVLIRREFGVEIISPNELLARL